jgi:hypothetical protein
METWEEMQRIEEVIHKSDGDGVRARWESGRYMLALKKGKQLPAGVLNELAEKLDVHRSELGARMKFATKCPTENELSMMIESYGTWSSIKKYGLTTTPRTSAKADDAGDDDLNADADQGDADDAEPADDDDHGDLDADADDRERAQRDLRRGIQIIEEIDAAMLDESDLELLVQAVQVIQAKAASIINIGIHRLGRIT